MKANQAMIEVRGLSKTFTLHLHGSTEIDALKNLNFSLASAECLGLVGESGAGKSTVLRLLTGHYLANQGSIKLWHEGQQVELVNCDPHLMLAIRKNTLGYVSQFLRVLPRVSTLDLLIQPLLERQFSKQGAREKAADVLDRMRIPERLWQLPPATFSGGEQQRINIARGLIPDYPILLLDEPTASLDPENRAIVIELLLEAKSRGTAMIGIFHDSDTRNIITDRQLLINPA